MTENELLRQVAEDIREIRREQKQQDGTLAKLHEELQLHRVTGNGENPEGKMGKKIAGLSTQELILYAFIAKLTGWNVLELTGVIP